MFVPEHFDDVVSFEVVGFDVFIIHAGPDKASALALRDALREVGLTAFVDEPDIRPGTEWMTEIPAALRGALIAVVLVGAEDGHYQNEEIQQAIADKRALGATDRVIPVRLQAGRDDLPYGLGVLQAETWDPPEALAAKLAARVAAIRGGPAAALTPRRARWEERYLDDKALLWRRGDPGLLGTAGGVRDRWYVHLKADFPWVEVDGRVAYLDAGPSAAELPQTADDPRAGGANGVPPTMIRAIEDRGRREARSWLDPLLSHPLLPRVVVVGTAGSGKTALLQHLAWVLTTDEARGAGDDPVHRVDRAGVRGGYGLAPVPVLHHASTLVAHLARGRAIREALVELLRETFGSAADVASLRAGIDGGRYVFLLDSLDEIPRQRDREALVAALGTLGGPAPRVVLTTRPSAHTAVELPTGFARVDIAPLDEPTADRLVRAWAASWAPGEDVEALRRVVASVRRTIPAQGDDRSPVESPLLLGCILGVYVKNRALPDDKVALYAAMVRDLCEARVDERDDDAREDEIARMRRQLRAVFLAAQEQGGTVLALEDAWDALVDCGLSRDEVERRLQVLANRTGLVRFEGAGAQAAARPWHRSFQEYLAAEAIALRYAERADDCVAWLRDPRGDRGARLHDAAWRGTLSFLIGATAQQRRAWATRLIDAVIAAAAGPGADQARLCALAADGAVEYAHDAVREALPRMIALAFEAHGVGWPVDDRIDALEALGRLGDPRLPDPRATVEAGWVEIPANVYVVGVDRAAPARVTRPARKRLKVAARQSLARVERAVPAFWIRRWPVTVAEFLPFVEDVAARRWTLAPLSLQSERLDGGPFSAAIWRAQAPWPSRPVVEVDWYTARNFCRWAGAHWRLPADGVIDLPTSAEWEIAARRGTERVFPWGDDPPGSRDAARAAYAWPDAPRLRPGPTPAGGFPLGHTPDLLWDLAGNVFEWCATACGPGALDLPIADEEDDPGGEVAYRGGSWQRGADGLVVTRQGDHRPGLDGNSIGFRVVCRPRMD